MKWSVCLFADGDGDGMCKQILMGTDGLVRHEVECLFVLQMGMETVCVNGP